MAYNDMSKRLEKRNAARDARARHSFYVEKLYEVAYASPNSIEGIAREFFYAVGALFEGTPPEELVFRDIDHREFLAAIKRA
jgi:hypothetical protein